MGISLAHGGLTSSHGERLVSGAGVGRHALANANASCRVASSIFGSQVLTAVLNAASAPEADVGRTDAVFVSVPERTRARYRCLRSCVLARTSSRLPRAISMSSYARLRLRPLQWSRRKALKFGPRVFASMRISPALVHLSFDWLLALSPASTRTTICLPSSSIEVTAVQDASACDVDSCWSICIASCASDFIGNSMRDGMSLYIYVRTHPVTERSVLLTG